MIAPAAAIQPGHEYDRPAQQRCRAEGACWKASGCAEKIDLLADFVAEGSIAEHADEHAVVERLVNPQHRIHAPERDHIEPGGRIDRRQPAGDLVGVVLVHRHRHLEARPALADGAGHLEAAQMRAHQKAALAAVERLLHDRLAFDGDLEQVVLAVDQVDTVVNGGGETQHVAEPVAGRGLAAERAAQIVAGMAARRGCEREEVGGDEIKEKAAGAAADAQRQERHHTQQQDTAALAARDPLGHLSALAGHVP